MPPHSSSHTQQWEPQPRRILTRPTWLPQSGLLPATYLVGASSCSNPFCLDLCYQLLQPGLFSVPTLIGRCCSLALPSLSPIPDSHANRQFQKHSPEWLASHPRSHACQHVLGLGLVLLGLHSQPAHIPADKWSILAWSSSTPVLTSRSYNSLQEFPKFPHKTCFQIWILCVSGPAQHSPPSSLGFCECWWMLHPGLSHTQCLDTPVGAESWVNPAYSKLQFPRVLTSSVVMPNLAVTTLSLEQTSGYYSSKNISLFPLRMPPDSVL